MDQSEDAGDGSAVVDVPDSGLSAPPNADPWFDRGGERPAPGEARVVELDEKKKHGERRFRIARYIIALYAVVAVALVVGWLAGVGEVAVMAAVFGNIGTLVAAVVAFYFAEDH